MAAARVPDIRPAATVLVVAKNSALTAFRSPALAAADEARESAVSDFKVFMVQRSFKAGFMPGAYVFPGGVTEAVDRDPKWKEICLSMIQDKNEDLTMHITAVREVFEESGLLLASTKLRNGVSLPDLAQWRADVNKDASKFLTMCLELSLVPAIDKMVQWSRWITPVVEKRRYDTMFFVAELDHEPEFAVHDSKETIATAWISPFLAIERHESGAMNLPPPTWLTLKELAYFPTLSALMGHGRQGRNLSPIQPFFKPSEKMTGILPGDAEHDEHPGPLPSSRNRIEWGSTQPYTLVRSPDVATGTGHVKGGSAAATTQVPFPVLTRSAL